MTRILVIHGAGLDMRGKVQQEIHGRDTLADYDKQIAESARQLGITVDIFQSNLEGEIVNRLYRGLDEGIKGAILNPGDFTVGYRALLAAIGRVTYPVIEVHVSNPMARGIVSDVGKVARASVIGFGVDGYRLALTGLHEMLA